MFSLCCVATEYSLNRKKGNTKNRSIKYTENAAQPIKVKVKKFLNRSESQPEKPGYSQGKAPSNKTPVFPKIMNMGIWVVGTSNQLFKRSS